jgi:hypothetical protein
MWDVIVAEVEIERLPISLDNRAKDILAIERVIREIESVRSIWTLAIGTERFTINTEE